MAKIQCRAKTTRGVDCRAPAGSNGFCFFHEHPDKARSLGQIGGRKNRAQMPDVPAPGSLNSEDLLAILAGAIHDVRSKKMSARTGGTLAQLCNSAYRMFPMADLEARVARLEKQLADQHSRTSVDTAAARTHGQEAGGGGTDNQTGDMDRRRTEDTEGWKEGSGRDANA